MRDLETWQKRHNARRRREVLQTIALYAAGLVALSSMAGCCLQAIYG
jgi:hypothetical protein